MSGRERLVRWLPALLGALLALVGLGAVGFAAQGLKLSLAPVEEPSPQVDPIALLRDDVSTIQRDLNGLSEGLGQNLERMAGALDEAGAARSQAQEARLARMEQRLGQLLAAQARLEQRIEGLQAAGLQAAGVAASSSAEPAPAEPAPAEPAPAEPAPAEPAPAATRPGLFSFKSSGGIDFDERLRFQVIGSLSRVGFDAKSTLHDFSGVTSDVEGELALRLADPGRDGAGQVSCQAATLRTGVDGRDEEMRKRLDTEHHPRLIFAMKSFQLGALDRDAKTVAGQVTGDMTIHGTTRTLTLPVRASVDPSRRLVLEGEVELNMSEFGIEPPTVGPITVEDRVKLWLSLRLRALGKAAPQ